MKRRAMTRAMAMLLAAAPTFSLHAQGDEVLGSRFFRTVITRNAKPLLAEAYFYDTEGVLVMQGLPLVDIISKAYGLQNFQIVDAPEWVRTAHLYDIKATLPPAFVESSETEMLQAMLADRFRLTAHTTEREITTLALTLEDETPGFSPTSTRENDVVKYRRYRPSLNDDFLVRANVTMQELALNFSRDLRQPVRDLTGLTETYAIEFKHTNSRDPAVWNTALLEQLGLRLEEKTATAEVLVITGIVQPELED